MDAGEDNGEPGSSSVTSGIDALEMLVLVGIVALCSVSMGSLASAPQPLAHAALSIVAFGCYGVATCAIARARVTAHASRRAAHARAVADAHAQTIDAFGSLIRRVERRAHDERVPGGMPPTDEARCATCAEMARVLAQGRGAAPDISCLAVDGRVRARYPWDARIALARGACTVHGGVWRVGMSGSDGPSVSGVSVPLSPSVFGPAEPSQRPQNHTIAPGMDVRIGACRTHPPSTAERVARRPKRSNRASNRSATGDLPSAGAQGRAADVRQPTAPNSPPTAGPVGDAGSAVRPLLASEPWVDETAEYGNDERQLNEFLRLHPMCSLQSTSTRVLRLVHDLSTQRGVEVPDVPIVPKSYDDAMLRPPDAGIGERPCVCGAQCLCSVMAKVRHGADTDLAFVGTEFLLPAERERFLGGGALPNQRKKCLVCCRYYQHYIYILARTDPNFDLTDMQVAPQAFCNAPRDAAAAMAARAARDAELPRSASPVLSTDGYAPEAMLFVDEGFADTRAARGDRIGALLWKPVVRFCSRHYRYRRDADGPRLVQVGVGANEQDFGQPPSPTAAAAEASSLRSIGAHF